MFFDTEDLSLNLLDVIYLRQSNINILNVNRNFDALSFRMDADTYIHTEDETHHLTDGSICYVPAHLPYRRTALKDELIVIHFDTLNYSFASLESIQPSQPDTLKILFEQILKCWNKKEPGYFYKCTSLLNMILAECTKDVHPIAKTQNQIQASIDFLEANYTNSNLTIQEIASKSYISEVYFRRLFKEIYKTSPAKYIINLRISKAISLMNMEYYTLHEVAELSGYDDYAYFSSEFKRIKGISPSKYLNDKQLL